ncbi:MAG: gas vesicle protein GvpG [Streptomycetaceae bacterium]|nr:gas vesicle protein GvpG [Streptomycetaceae bacterium]
MGLFTGLLTLPLAPARGVVWIAEQIYQEALRRNSNPSEIRRRLAEVEQAREAGQITAEEGARLEEELVRRLFPPDASVGGLEV